MPSISYFKKQAKKLLYDNWIQCIGAFFTVAVSLTAISLAASAFVTIAAICTNEIVSAVVITLSAILLATFTIPFMYGVFVFAYNTVGTGKSDIFDLFYAFSSLKRYLRSYSLFYSVIWRGLIVFFVPLAVSEELYLYTTGKSLILDPVSFLGTDITYTAICIVLVLAAMYSLAYYTRYFTAIYLVIDREDAPVSQCFFAANAYNYHMKSQMFVAMMAYLPLVAISILTFGLLFIIYTVPVIVFTFFLFASYRVSDKNHEISVCKEIFGQQSTTEE